MRNTYRKDNTVVFSDIVNKAAFIDRIAFSVKGVGSETPKLKRGTHYRIASEKGAYGHARNFFTELGNPCQRKYGNIHRWPRVPDSYVTFRSESRPLTAQECTDTLNAMFEEYKVTLQYFDDHVFTNARKITHRPISLPIETIYFGSRYSPLQLRIYQKRETVVRFELIFRHRKLDITQLRTLRSADFVRIKDFNRTELQRVYHYAPPWKLKMLLNDPVLRLQELSKWIAEYDDQFEFSRVLQTSPLETRIKDMLGNLVF